MEVPCKNCGSVWNIPDWICEFFIDMLAEDESWEPKFLRCARCGDVDEWVQGHRIKKREMLNELEA